MNEINQTPMSEASTLPSTAISKITANNIIRKYQESSREDIMNESPAIISAEIVLLSAKLHEAGSLALIAEQTLMRKWAEIREQVETDGKADKLVKVTDEYHDSKMASINEKIVLEVIRALKKLLASKADEARGIM